MLGWGFGIEEGMGEVLEHVQPPEAEDVGRGVTDRIFIQPVPELVVVSVKTGRSCACSGLGSAWRLPDERIADVRASEPSRQGECPFALLRNEKSRTFRLDGFQESLSPSFQYHASRMERDRLDQGGRQEDAKNGIQAAAKNPSKPGVSVHPRGGMMAELIDAQRDDRPCLNEVSGVTYVFYRAQHQCRQNKRAGERYQILSRQCDHDDAAAQNDI